MKLYIPGPITVDDEILQAMSGSMIGHRMPEFAKIYEPMIEKLKKLLFTEQDVFTITSSATGVWELCIRNLVQKKALACCQGAFSDRWADVVEFCGKETERLTVEWGEAITPELLDEALAKAPDVDTLLLVHNETSTGVMNPLKEICEMMRDKYPDVMICVDAVSSMSGVKIEVDAWGIDILLAGLQKAFAMPPGFAVFSCSARALERAETVEGRGYYFDLLGIKKTAMKHQTVSTPSLSHIYALSKQVDRFFEEGLDARFARHEEMCAYIRGWVKENFEMFAPEKYASITLTTGRNTKGISISKLNEILIERYDTVISNGYGKLKDDTFRIAHMGDMTMEDMRTLTGQLDEILKEL